MFENFMGMLRKRRRVEEQTNPSVQAQASPNLTANTFWDSLFFASNSSDTLAQNNSSTSCAAQPSCSETNALQLLDRYSHNTHCIINCIQERASVEKRAKLDPTAGVKQQPQPQQQQSNIKLSPNTTSTQNVTIAAKDNKAQFHWSAVDESESHLIAPPSPFHPNSQSYTEEPNTAATAVTQTLSTKIQGEDMEIDSAPVPPPQEYSDCPSAYHSESSMNFDYLHSLHEGTSNTDAMMDSSSSSPYYNNSPRHFGGVGAAATASSTVMPTYGGHVDDSKVMDRPFNLNERFVTVLDQLDARVEKFRKDALGLQEKRDFLLMSIDLIKSNDLMTNMNESEREEITCYIQRVNSRLSTVELNVRTVRDCSQEDSLSQINALIDLMITMGDPVMSRQRCQQYLNSCCSSGETGGGCCSLPTFPETNTASGGIFDIDAGPVDKKFESALLGCTLDDQKNIKKRLQALMGYLNKQTIRD